MGGKPTDKAKNKWGIFSDIFGTFVLTITVHSATGMTPYSRYMEDIAHIRMPKSSAWLDECFLHRVKRRVNNDATVMINKTLFDAPMEFIRSTVEVRYRPGEPDSAFILDNGTRYPLSPTDKAANSKTKRNNGYQIRYGGDT